MTNKINFLSNSFLGVGALIFIVLSTSGAHAEEVHVEIITDAPCYYCPDPVVINLRDTVVWTNGDSTIHTATSGTPDGGPTGLFGGRLDSPTLIVPSRTQSFTFDEAGEFPYYCILHPSMIGLVVVSIVDGTTVANVTATFEGRDYNLVSEAVAARIISAQIVPDERVIAEFDFGDDVHLIVPKAALSEITGVMAGEDVLEFQIVDDNESATTIFFSIPDDNLSVVIVPEFPASIPIIASIGVFILATAAMGRFNLLQFWKG